MQFKHETLLLLFHVQKTTIMIVTHTRKFTSRVLQRRYKLIEFHVRTYTCIGSYKVKGENLFEFTLYYNKFIKIIFQK